MTIIRLKHLQRFKDRHGKIRIYFRKPGQKRVALPHEDDPEFFRAYQAAFSQAADPDNKPPPPKTFARLITDWLNSPRFMQLASTTQVNYRRILMAMQKEDYADHFVVDFEARHLRRFVARLADRPAAANHRIKMFRMLFDYAVDDGWREDNPALTLKRLREKADGAETWSDEHIRQYESYWPTGSTPRLALALLLYTGQRRSDVVKMGAKHVRGDLISVTQQKTGVRLLIPIHPHLAQELSEALDAETFLQTARGEAFTANGFYMRFKSWRSAAGLPEGLSPHGLRKAAARRLAEAGCSAHQIASITGHASLSEVQRYTRAVDQEKLAREAMARFLTVKPNPKTVKPD